MSVQNDKYRLPLNVKPTHYDVTVWTDLEKLSFGGSVKISLDVLEDTSAFTLNSNKLELGTASLNSDGNEQLQSGHTIDTDMQRVTFNFPTILPAGSSVQLKIPFNAPLGSSMTGYYKAAWEKDGKTAHYSLTQFEPTDARAAFPSWDEPALKATYAITMISRAENVNLSNMPAISEEPYKHDFVDTLGGAPLSKDSEWKITRFATTPPMSSYIVAFASGPFVHLEEKVHLPLSNKTIPLRIYSTPDVIHQAAFALDVAVRVLPIYETVFEVEYPLPKLDTLVAADFDAGAMENWGLITGRTTALLLDPARADVHAKKNVAYTQSHEVAHMFGNITTMAWWDSLFLNEAFATLMGEVIIITIFTSRRIFPEWRPDSEFISDHLQSALALDAKLSSHPIEVECPDANHINQIFDALSYSKGASVLRMLSDYIGEDKFLKGVSIYLKRHQFSNTVTNDLFSAISEATPGVDAVQLMDNWITKIGFPVITVTENESGIHLRQDRFIESGVVEPKDNETVWSVPLSIVSEKNGQKIVDKTAMLEDREKNIALDTSRPFKLNSGTVGVYRVSYTPERLAKIAAEATKENSIFTLEDRMGILYDVTALSKAGLAKLSDTLTVIELWSNEKEHLVWSSISQTLLSLLVTFWEHPKIVENLRALIRSLFVPIVKRLGYEYPPDEPIDITELRTLAISMSVSGEDQGVINELKSRFSHYVQTGDRSRIPADLQSVIFRSAVRFGGAEEYEAVVKIQETPKTPTERLTAMTATQDQALLDKTFSYILTKSRDQDIIYYFRGLQGNNFSRRQLAGFFKTNYDLACFSRAIQLHFLIGVYLVSSSFSGMSSKADCEDVESFFKDKDNSKYSMALAQTLEGIRTRIIYIERSSDDLAGWLQKWEKRTKL
ncbi:leucyl aminopeptidase [Roridomyces roridus]|uniref:Aminopeptidase n=1 Tax=Roridomyces roridus TaxID=1738132 RepID=A0AAD7BWI5_9AGAR|nr:leucyl aminopeptidase [Roridomyces roridus]